MPIDDEMVYFVTPAGKAIIQVWRKGMWQYLRDAEPIETKMQMPIGPMPHVNPKVEDIKGWISDMPGMRRFHKGLFNILGAESPITGGITEAEILAILDIHSPSREAMAIHKQIQSLHQHKLIELCGDAWMWSDLARIRPGHLVAERA